MALWGRPQIRSRSLSLNFVVFIDLGHLYVDSLQVARTCRCSILLQLFGFALILAARCESLNSFHILETRCTFFAVCCTTNSDEVSLDITIENEAIQVNDAISLYMLTIHQDTIWRGADSAILSFDLERLNVAFTRTMIHVTLHRVSLLLYDAAILDQARLVNWHGKRVLLVW